MNEEYKKDFDCWNERKKELDSKKIEGFYHEREIWWCSLGVNIGSEQDGKNTNFERPVLILRKMAEMLLVVPLTSKIENYEHRINTCIAGEQSQILTAQIRAISNRRLLRRIGFVKNTAYQEVIISLVKIFTSYRKPNPGEAPDS